MREGRCMSLIERLKLGSELIMQYHVVLRQCVCAKNKMHKFISRPTTMPPSQHGRQANVRSMTAAASLLTPDCWSCQAGAGSLETFIVVTTVSEPGMFGGQKF